VGGTCLLSCALLLILFPASGQSAGRDWTNYVRIGAYGLRTGNADEIVRSAQEDGVFGIEVDNDIPGRYESFLHPEAKLAAIQAVAAKAHSAHNRAFVYIAGLECITANAANTPHSLAKEHSDWLQRKLTGEPAVFAGGAAFWIAKGDEDVWVSPFAPEWRKLYMERVRQIAATGIDGIYVDIPYWMTHFDGWEDSWASFDDYTVAAFKKQTGLDAKKELKLGDFSDPKFRAWVNFRMEAITDFVQEIDRNAKSVNPAIKTIPEIYPGIEGEAPRVGADVYRLYPLVDAIAHEYEFGGGDHMASSRTPLDWLCYQVGMYSFRAFADGKPTWILNYSWDGDKRVDAREAMMNLAASETMAGANFWDAPGHSMAGSNDRPTRRKIMAWINAHENTLYAPRESVDPVGVYFSPPTRDFYSDDFIASYRGVLILLMQDHCEFQVVTPRTLAKFKGRTLVLPDVKVLNDMERASLREYVAAPETKLVITGDDATGLSEVANILRFRDCPGKAYYTRLQKSFDQARPEEQEQFLKALQTPGTLRIQAGPEVATSIARVDGNVHVFLVNFTGLRGGVNPVQTPQTDVEITVSGEGQAIGHFLPFMGDEQAVGGRRVGDRIAYKLPVLEKAGVFWTEQ